MTVKSARKALVALGASVVSICALFGVVVDSNTVAAIAAAAAPLLVYGVRNL